MTFKEVIYGIKPYKQRKLQRKNCKVAGRKALVEEVVGKGRAYQAEEA